MGPEFQSPKILTLANAEDIDPRRVIFEMQKDIAPGSEIIVHGFGCSVGLKNPFLQGYVHKRRIDISTSRHSINPRVIVHTYATLGSQAFTNTILAGIFSSEWQTSRGNQAIRIGRIPNDNGISYCQLGEPIPASIVEEPSPFRINYRIGMMRDGYELTIIPYGGNILAGLQITDQEQLFHPSQIADMLKQLNLSRVDLYENVNLAIAPSANFEEGGNILTRHTNHFSGKTFYNLFELREGRWFERKPTSTDSRTA